MHGLFGYEVNNESFSEEYRDRFYSRILTKYNADYQDVAQFCDELMEKIKHCIKEDSENKLMYHKWIQSIDSFSDKF
jgi:hypothetical protein